MQIKKANNRNWLPPFPWIVGIILLIITWLFFIEYPARKIPKTNPEVTPDSILQYVAEQHNIEEVFQFFKDYTIFLSVKEDAALKMPDAIRSFFIDKGSEKIEQLGPWDAYAAVVRNGQIEQEKLKGKSPVYLNSRHYKVGSAGVATGNFSTLSWNGMNIDSPHKGLNVYVCHPNYRDIFQFAFDYSTQENPLSKDVLNKPHFTEVETIEIRLSEKQFRKIQEKRKAALKAKILFASEDDFVPAKIVYQEEIHKADIRLKGDWVDHLEDDKWSFRVKLEDASMMGMRKFSLHHPKTRNYAGEWFFHELLAEYGILNLQYHFVQVVLVVEGQLAEGKNLGLYALEEGFDKFLVERNKRREGVLIKFDEDPIWQERAYFINNQINLSEIGYFSHADYPKLNILPFNQKKVLRDSTFSRQFQTAKTLLSDYINDKKEIKDVFDVELLAQYNAICNLLGADHALLPHNFRFYYNPISSKLEPVGFDGNAFKSAVQFPAFYKSKNDLTYMRAYGRALEVITAPQSLERLQQNESLIKQVNLLKKEFPEHDLKMSTLRRNAALIKLEIFPKKCLNVFVEDYQEGMMKLSIENFSRFHVEILGLQTVDKKPLTQLSENIILKSGDRQTFLMPMDEDYQKLFVSKKQKRAKFDLIKDAKKVLLQWRVLGTGPVRTVGIVPWQERFELTSENDLFRRKPNAHKFDFLEIDEEDKTINFKRGHWTLTETLIVPPGYTLKAGPGTSIDLANYFARIISFSPVQFIGDEQEAFELKSSTGKGEGLLVMETKDTSLLEYCRFVNLSNPSTKTWAISGAVNFYAAPVKIKHCDFTKNRSEDALNIISTWFDMENTLFAQTQSDAFDGDFVKGQIRQSNFVSLGNDAIDVSGSEIEVEDVVISEAGDKGLSAGESSLLNARNIKIFNSEIAVASKDRSKLIIENLEIENNKIGFTAFQKKAEFGPSIIEAIEVKQRKNELIYLIEEASSLLLEGQKAATTNRVLERLYGAEYGKSSQ